MPTSGRGGKTKSGGQGIGILRKNLCFEAILMIFQKSGGAVAPPLPPCFQHPWLMYCLFVYLNGRLPKGRRWVSHKGICLTSGNRTNVPTSLGRVNPNTAAAEIRTRRLARHQAATRTQADWNSVCDRRGTRECAPPLVEPQL